VRVGSATLRVGSATLHHAVFWVLPDRDLYLSAKHYPIHATLGFPALAAPGRLTFTGDERFARVVPYTRNDAPDASSNLFLKALQPVVAASLDGQLLRQRGAERARAVFRMHARRPVDARHIRAVTAERPRPIMGLAQINTRGIRRQKNRTMADKKAHKPNLSPEAAKILEQYRNAGKPAKTASDDESGPSDAEAGVYPKASAPPPSMMRRSGTRGK
jgi:hypothetical protein